MHLFISAGEPSGDLHGSNLIHALRARDPSIEIVGFGGERMQAAGAKLLYPLAKLSVMGFRRVIANLRTFFRIGDQAEQYFKTQRPDAVILIDYPGFHLPLAKRAKAAGIPVYYFVPPQIWAWKTWRVKKVRRDFDRVLTALPFEEEWYRSRGVNTRYVGHPYYDELAAQKLDANFLDHQRAKPGPVIAILPGSRNQEVTGNAPLMLAAASQIHAARPDARFLVAAFNEQHAGIVRTMASHSQLPIEVHVNRTPEIIETATACIAVSGSVGLEMMYRCKPAVVVYRVGAIARWLLRRILRVKYISLVNLLADEEVYPESHKSDDDSAVIAGNILTWLNSPSAMAATTCKLQTLKSLVAVPGACERAAEFILEAVRARQTLRNAA
jgi:lipid-A-disaccharide synthase